MKTFLAWHNLRQNHWQTAAATAGVGFAIFLMFAQLGIRGAVERNAVLIYDTFDYDIALTSPQYVFLVQPGTIARSRVYQARQVPGVASVTPVYLARSDYRDLDSRRRQGMLVLGVNPREPPFRVPEINDQLPRLTAQDTVLIDRESRPECGPTHAGIATELDGHRVQTIGNYHMGSGFVANGTLVLGETTYMKVIPDAAPDRVNLGLVRLAPGHSATDVVESLRAALGPDVTVHTRASIEGKEQAYWLHIRPIGIMFTTGVVLSFIVGAVTLYQVLLTETTERRREYATLKALGYTDGYLVRLVMAQAAMFVALAFGPAYVLALICYAVLRAGANVPAYMTVERVVLTLFLVGLMSAAATGLTLHRLRSADPADLF